MTEGEAKAKWCPFVQIAAGSIDTHAFTNREVAIGDMPQGEASRCIGSACMAWRTTEIATEETLYAQPARPEGKGWEQVSDSPRNSAWTRKLETPIIYGHCGLARRP